MTKSDNTSVTGCPGHYPAHYASILHGHFKDAADPSKAAVFEYTQFRADMLPSQFLILCFAILPPKDVRNDCDLGQAAPNIHPAPQQTIIALVPSQQESGFCLQELGIKFVDTVVVWSEKV